MPGYTEKSTNVVKKGPAASCLCGLTVQWKHIRRRISRAFICFSSRKKWRGETNGAGDWFWWFHTQRAADRDAGRSGRGRETSQCQVSEPRPRFLIFLEAVDRLDGGRACLACSFHCCPPCTWCRQTSLWPGLCIFPPPLPGLRKEERVCRRAWLRNFNSRRERASPSPTAQRHDSCHCFPSSPLWHLREAEAQQCAQMLLLNKKCFRYNYGAIYSTNKQRWNDW